MQGNALTVEYPLTEGERWDASTILAKLRGFGMNRLLRMHTLHGKSAVVLTSKGSPISVGKFEVIAASALDHTQRVELCFETETMACRLRVPLSKVDEIKRTWDGDCFRYVLPPGDIVWGPIKGSITTAKEEPTIETFPLPPGTMDRKPRPIVVKGRASGAVGTVDSRLMNSDDGLART